MAMVCSHMSRYGQQSKRPITPGVTSSRAGSCWQVAKPGLPPVLVKAALTPGMAGSAGWSAPAAEAAGSSRRASTPTWRLRRWSASGCLEAAELHDERGLRLRRPLPLALVGEGRSSQSTPGDRWPAPFSVAQLCGPAAGRGGPAPRRPCRHDGVTSRAGLRRIALLAAARVATWAGGGRCAGVGLCARHAWGAQAGFSASPCVLAGPRRWALCPGRCSPGRSTAIPGFQEQPSRTPPPPARPCPA